MSVRLVVAGSANATRRGDQLGAECGDADEARALHQPAAGEALAPLVLVGGQFVLHDVSAWTRIAASAQGRSVPAESPPQLVRVHGPHRSAW